MKMRDILSRADRELGEELTERAVMKIKAARREVRATELLLKKQKKDLEKLLDSDVEEELFG